MSNPENFSCILEEITDREAFTPEYWEIELNTPEDYAVVVIYLVIFFTGVPLNVLIISRIIYKRLYKQPTFILLLNLAVCDLLICLVPILFNIITEFMGMYSFGPTDYIRCNVCKVSTVFIILNFLSTFNLALLSLDRFIFFRFSIKYTIFCTPKRVLLALGVIWTLSILFGIPPLAGYGDVTFSLSCGLVFALSPAHVLRSIPYIVFGVTAHSVVIVILVVTNVWIVHISCKQLKTLKVSPICPGPMEGFDMETRIANRDRAILKKQLKLLQVFGAILLVHFLTLIPAILLVIIISIVGDIPPAFYTVVLFSFSSQATLHPLVESFFTPELRKLVTRCCGKRKGPRRKSAWMEKEL